MGEYSLFQRFVIVFYRFGVLIGGVSLFVFPAVATQRSDIAFDHPTVYIRTEQFRNHSI